MSKAIQMDRRGHVMQGMDRVYMHVTHEMRRRLCDVLEQLWHEAVTQRYMIDPHSKAGLLGRLLATHDRRPGASLGH